MTTLVNHGTPVVSSRQWTTGLSPNVAGTGWNYILQAWAGSNPTEWIVVKDLTGAWSQATYEGTRHFYANSTRSYANQLRATNGRIFFMLFGVNVAYYDPTDEQVHFLPTIVETPPINPNASTALYSATFDVAGLLYMATQESGNRPSMVVVIDPVSLSQTILGYVGDGATGYTTYGYYIAADTTTAEKYTYVVYGQSSWQLWALNNTTGAATKLYEVASAGHMAFTNITGKGWIATIDTFLNDPSNVRTQWWCLDGALYAYTAGVDPPVAARNVTPASNPLVSPPGLDTSGGAGVVGWRPNGSSGAYEYINYTVAYTTAQPIESLVNTPDGILGNAVQYQGFFRVIDASGEVTWYGSEVGLVNVSQGPRLNLPGNAGSDAIYIAGYPNGVLYQYDPNAAWRANVAPTVNPSLIGYYGPSNTLSAVKYATCLAWSPGAGSSGRLYMGGRRERTGVGGGVGYWDRALNTFAGTYATPLDTIHPLAMVALDASSRIAMSTQTRDGTGTAPLYVFDRSLAIVDTQTPIAAADIGVIFPTNNPDVVCGIMQQTDGIVAVYRHDIATNTLLAYTATAYSQLDVTSLNQSDGSVWVSAGVNLFRVDPDTLVVTFELDLTPIGVSIECMAFYGTTLYMSKSATLWSANLAQTVYQLDAVSGSLVMGGNPVAFELGSSNVLQAQSGSLGLAGDVVVLSASFSMTARSGQLSLYGSPTTIGETVGTLVFASTNILRYLVTSTDATPLVITSDGSASPDLLTDAVNGPLRKMAQAFTCGYGSIAAGELTTAQAKAIWAMDGALGDVRALRARCSITSITASTGLMSVIDVAAVANRAVITVTPPAGASTFYVDVEVPGAV